MVVVSDNLVYGVCVVDLFFCLGLALDEVEWDSVDEEDYVGADVLVAVEGVLVGACEDVVPWVAVVDEPDGLALLPGRRLIEASFFSQSKNSLFPRMLVGRFEILSITLMASFSDWRMSWFNSSNDSRRIGLSKASVNSLWIS